METKQIRVLSFLDDEVERYVLGDLAVLAAIRPDPSTGLRGCTVPQAMLIFAVLDLLGFLVRLDARKTDTTKNLGAIFSSGLGLFPKEYEAERERIVYLFRHGIVHQFFPKASAVAKLGPSKPLMSRSEGICCLNIDKLTEDFIHAFRVLRERIASGRHDALVERINDRLDKLAADDSEKDRKLREEASEPPKKGGG